MKTHTERKTDMKKILFLVIVGAWIVAFLASVGLIFLFGKDLVPKIKDAIERFKESRKHNAVDDEVIFP